jgi:SSS family solute:Na+ symporter
MSSTLSQVLLFGVLISFLIVGLLYKKKPKTMKEYALGNGKFSTLVLVCTMVATAFGGGSIIGASAALYQNGAWLFFGLLASVIGSCIASLVTIPRLSKYYGCKSIAEVIGRMYGVYARKLVGVFAFIYCVGILGAQIKALHWVMEHMFIQNALIATIVGVLIVILYSSFGGVSSVIKTDVLQFFIFIVILPLLASYIIRISGGITTIAHYAHKSDRTFFYGGSVGAFIALILVGLSPNLAPHIFHRILVGRDCKKNQATFYASAFVALISTIFAGCIAFIALAKFPSIDPQSTAFIVIQSFVKAQLWMVLFIIALVAMIISTADSLINTGAIILVNDIVTKKMTEGQKVKLLRVVTIFSGIIATSFACLFSTVLDIALFFSEYYLVIVLVPLVGGLFVKETRREPFWASVSTGMITFSSLHLAYRNLSHVIFLISSIASLSAYLATVFIFQKEKAQTSTFSFRKLCDEIVAGSSIQPGKLGCIILLLFILSMALRVVSDGHDAVVMIIEGLTGAFGFLLLCIDLLPIKYKNAIVLGVIWYCIAFSPVYVFLHQKVLGPFVINSIISVMVLMWLFSWNAFLTFLLSGSSVAIITFGFLSNGFQGAMATVMSLFLFLGSMAAVAYIALNKKERMLMKKLEANQDSAVYDKVIKSIISFAVAESRYRDILLNGNKITQSSFKELKENILGYFQRLSSERKTKLTVINSRHKVLETVLPLSSFYEIIYSMMLTVLYCNNGEDIQIKFVCNGSNRVQSLEIIHGRYKINDMVRYVDQYYPENILRWEEIKNLFKQQEIKLVESANRLKVIFPSEVAPAENRIISFKKLPAAQAVANETD